MRSSYSLYALILAGGVGTRLWPRSRSTRPKQLLDLVSSETMLQTTVRRVSPIIPPENLLVITGEDYARMVRRQVPQLPGKNVVVETEARGTAAAIGLGAIHLGELDPDGVMASLHADHFIKDEEGFRQALLAAGELAAEGHLVTLGIVPDSPHTGYGYIRQAEPLGERNGHPTYRVERFLEKPDVQTARRFLDEGGYYWNSGIFVWKISTILEEFAAYLPDTHDVLMKVSEAIGRGREKETLAELWPTIKRQSIDVGIMEKSGRVAVVPVDIGWSDVGDWAAIRDICCANGDADNVTTEGTEHISLDTHGTFIDSRGKTVATIGLNDLIIVETGDVLLVCSRDRAQDVKKLVDILKDKGRKELL